PHLRPRLRPRDQMGAHLHGPPRGGIRAWEKDGVRAELLPVVGLDDELTGVTAEGDTLFVALARLTAERDPRPLADLASVRVEGTELYVTWADGSETRFRLERAEG
ncbi:hypothetical protein PV366_48890, partial [Streptomyces ipomoeae]|nr:hypothetical protein [Streptomyces ipomoeae]